MSRKLIWAAVKYNARVVHSSAPCLRLLRTSRRCDYVLNGQKVIDRKMAGEGREHTRRPIFGLALREKQAPDLFRYEVRSNGPSL
jgi:hypothetical protein